MGNPIGRRCIRCGTEYGLEGHFKGCPKCLAADRPTQLAVRYDYNKVKQTFHPGRLQDRPHTIWRYHELLPVPPEQAVSIGEGMTPLLPVPNLAKKLGLKNLYVKDESRNPTWSFKDRLASGAVSAARRFGAKVITGSSSGNAGSATAAYAARAGLPCVMFTTQQFPLAMKTQMGVYGTRLIACPSVKDRWLMVEACVDQLGWWPVTVFVYPLVGSNSYGIDGYKSIGYELVEQLGGVPDRVIMPVGAGDAFFGAWQGFTDYQALGFIDRLPKMMAAEVFHPLENALAKGLDHVAETEWGPTVAISVGLNISAYQALHTLRQSGGAARSATDEEMIAMQQDLAACEGIYVEASSVLSLAVTKKMADEGLLDPDETLVAFLTSSGLKDPETTSKYLPEIPLCQPDLDSLRQVLRETYAFEMV